MPTRVIFLAVALQANVTFPFMHAGPCIFLDQAVPN